MNKTKIEYADYTWNPMTGCRINCGDFCYAEKIVKRYGHYNSSFAPQFHPDKLGQPAKMKKPSVIFVCDMGDIFSPGTKGEWRMKVRAAADAAPWHTYLWLTKSPNGRPLGYDESWCRPNWWLGSTITGPEDAWKREVMDGDNHWISYEPLFGVPDERHLWHTGQMIIGRATNYKSGWCDVWARQITKEYQRRGTPVFWKNNIGSKGPKELAWANAMKGGV